MKRLILFVVVFGIALPSMASAIGFGGYYTMSFPTVDYDSYGCAPDFGGANVKAWYDFSDKVSIELSSGFYKFQLESDDSFDEDIGNIRPWNISLGGRYTVKKFGRFGTYVTGGGGFYRISIEDHLSWIEGTGAFRQSGKYVYEKPGVYLGGGLKTHPWGPLSAEVNPVFSYVLGIEKYVDINGNEYYLSRFYSFDINIGMAVDL